MFGDGSSRSKEDSDALVFVGLLEVSLRRRTRSLPEIVSKQENSLHAIV